MGLRRGEFLALRWANVSFTSGILRVVETIEITREYGLRIKPPKSESGIRTLALPKIVSEILRAHRIIQMEERLQTGPDWSDNDLVCPNTKGRHWHPRNFHRAYRDLMNALDLPYVSPHELRHTHFTHLLQANVHPNIAKERAGHSSVAITMDIYSHVMPNMQEEAARKIDDVLRVTRK